MSISQVNVSGSSVYVEEVKSGAESIIIFPEVFEFSGNEEITDKCILEKRYYIYNVADAKFKDVTGQGGALGNHLGQLTISVCGAYQTCDVYASKQFDSISTSWLYNIKLQSNSKVRNLTYESSRAQFDTGIRFSSGGDPSVNFPVSTTTTVNLRNPEWYKTSEGLKISAVSSSSNFSVSDSWYTYKQGTCVKLYSKES